MSKVEVEFQLDKSAFRKEVLQADWMLNHIESVAKKECPEGRHPKSFIGFDRAKSILYKNTEDYPK